MSFVTEVNMTDKYDALKLENQLCFPLYACAKEVVRMYKPFLDKIDLTYTQYITMMVLWEKKIINVKDLGKILFLDSGTLTPVLKGLEKKKYITRTRKKEDERVVIVELTTEGEILKEKAVNIPPLIANCISLEQDEALTLYKLLNKMLEK